MTESAAGGLSPTFPSTEWLAALRARGTDPAFAGAREALDERVDGYHRVLPDIPERQAGYYHDFFCPEHAVQLVFDPRDGHHHACPVDGHVFSGEPFDSAWGWSVNDALSDAALRAAVRFVMAKGGAVRAGSAAGAGAASGTAASGKAASGTAAPDSAAPDTVASDTAASDTATADAGLVRHVLLGYAARYRTMPPSPRGYPGPYVGVVCWSALDESVWIIRMAWAAALLRTTWTPEEAASIRTGLLEPAFEHLRRVAYRQIQNVANWDNSANLTLAWILGDEAAVEDLLHGEYGVRDELTRGVGADGMWWEGSLSYHYYVLGALSWTIRGLRAAGRPFEHESVVRSMFRAPIDLAFPDLSLPAMNDCWYHISLVGEVGHGIPGAEGLHELAYGWFGDPAFAWVVDENRRLRPRRTFEALLDGAASVPAAAAPERASRLFEPTGFAVLRSNRPPAEQTQVILKAGGDGDAHGHADQLALQAFSHGRRLALDPGTPGYGIPLNDTWYRQTASHSTVLLDSRAQPPVGARIGAVEMIRSAADRASRASAEVTWPGAAAWPAVIERAVSCAWTDGASEVYIDVQMRRWVVLTDDYLIDAFGVDAPETRTIDWLWHERGRFAGRTEPALGALAGTCGYDELLDVRRIVRIPVAAGGSAAASLDRPALRLTWEFDDARVDVWLAPADEEVFLASAPGNPAADRHDLLVRRLTARSTVFAAVIAPAGRSAAVSDVSWAPTAGGWAVIVTVGSGRQRLAIGPAGIVVGD